MAIFCRNDFLLQCGIVSCCTAEPTLILRLLAFYRPPNQNACQFIEDLKQFHWPAGRICMTGDLNIDLLKNKKHIVVDYLNTLADVGVEAVIKLSTRIELLRDKLVSSCLDHVNVRLHSIYN
ncbi:hypothetical protein HPB48_019442 [Haemaphysalis longicornis]|uniref:Endonuclease/exonuclease/phosphatase domain-containing protein n=1 Tax=Haemaphysalis longicornis TaxID=44386 RepID=A0A9J6FPQ4_HAELO|nr:hypothetical protein HPB48_019442 [Haemaphysalis longicornis]